MNRIRVTQPGIMRSARIGWLHPDVEPNRIIDARGSGDASRVLGCKFAGWGSNATWKERTW
jgi:hypothetical protein